MVSLLLIAMISLSSLLVPCNGMTRIKVCNFDQIYQVGDSISDTGNLIRESMLGAATPFARLPYGETSFNNATGRCSNGLLMIDYIGMEH